MPDLRAIVAVTGESRAQKKSSDESSFCPREGSFAKSQKSAPLARGDTKRIEDGRRPRHGEYAHGESSARVSDLGFVVGWSDFHGASSAAKNKERRRIEKMRTRSPRSSRRLQVIFTPFSYSVALVVTDMGLNDPGNWETLISIILSFTGFFGASTKFQSAGIGLTGQSK